MSLENFCALCGSLYDAGTTHACTNAPRSAPYPSSPPATARPMQGLAELLRGYAKLHYGDHRSQFLKWASEVEAAQAQPASAPTGQPSDKVYCTACDMTTQDKERCSDCPRRTARWYADATPVQVTSAVARGEAAQQKLTQEYRRNILEGVANWMRSRHSTIWATEFGYTGLMATWADELDQIRRELSGVQPHGVTLSAEDAHFLAVRLRRLCEHLKYALPKFAEDDAALVNIAGTVIGALLANMTYGVQRYKVVTGSQSKHCCFHATVVDTLKPTIIAGKHWNNEFEALCECFSPADAEQIAAVLNATTGVHTPDPFIEHFAKEEAAQPHSYDAGGVRPIDGGQHG